MNISNLIFPKRCPVCDEILNPMGHLMCKECVPFIRYMEEPRCYCCSKQLTFDEGELCKDCKENPHEFERGWALYEYTGISDTLYRFKYQTRPEYADFFAKDIRKHYGEMLLGLNVDGLVPVPLHPKRQRRRGYNQAEELARALGRELGISVRSDLIERCRNTRPQKELDNTLRQNNLKKAFNLLQNDVKLKSIIIIDDIYTTGSTIDAVAHELNKIVSGKIYFLTLAIGAGF